MSSVGRREKGLKEEEGEGEGEEESGGREQGEVILLNLWEVGESCQHVLELPDCTPSLSTLDNRSCSSSEMRKWEKMEKERGLTLEYSIHAY